MFLRESLGVSRDVSICKYHYCRIYVRNLGSWKFFGKQIWPIHFLAQNLLELVQNIHLWWFISHGFFLIFKGNSWEKSIHSIGVSSSFIVPSFGHFLGHNLARKIPPFPPFPSPGVSAANDCGTLRDLAIFGSTEAKNRTEKIGFSGEKNGVFWKLWHFFVEIFECLSWCLSENIGRNSLHLLLNHHVSWVVPLKIP